MIQVPRVYAAPRNIVNLEQVDDFVIIDSDLRKSNLAFLEFFKALRGKPKNLVVESDRSVDFLHSQYDVDQLHKLDHRLNLHLRLPPQISSHTI